MSSNIPENWRELVFNHWVLGYQGMSANDAQLEESFNNIFNSQLAKTDLDSLKIYILKQGIKEGWLQDEMDMSNTELNVGIEEGWLQSEYFNNGERK